MRSSLLQRLLLGPPAHGACRHTTGGLSFTAGSRSRVISCAASGDDDTGGGADRSFKPKVECPHCRAKVTVGQEEGHLKACSAARGLSEAARQHRVQELRGLARGGPRRGGGRGTRALYVDEGDADADTELDPDSDLPLLQRRRERGPQPTARASPPPQGMGEGQGQGPEQGPEQGRGLGPGQDSMRQAEGSRYRLAQASMPHGKVSRTAAGPTAAVASPTAATNGHQDAGEAGLAGGASTSEADGVGGPGAEVAPAVEDWLVKPRVTPSDAAAATASGQLSPPPPLQVDTAYAQGPGPNGAAPGPPGSMHTAMPGHQRDAWQGGAGGEIGGNGAPSSISNGTGGMAGPAGRQGVPYGVQQQQPLHAGGHNGAPGANHGQVPGAAGGNGVAGGNGHSMGAAPPAPRGYQTSPGGPPVGYPGTHVGSNGQPGPPLNAFYNRSGVQQSFNMQAQQLQQPQHMQPQHSPQPQQQPYPYQQAPHHGPQQQQQQPYFPHQQQQQPPYPSNGGPPSAFPLPPGQWRPQGTPGPGAGQGPGWAQGPAGAMHGPGPDPRVQGAPVAGPRAWQGQGQGQGQRGPAFGGGGAGAAGGRATAAAAAARPPVGSAARRPVGAPIRAPGNATTQPLDWEEPPVIDEEAGEREAQPLDPGYRKALEARMVRGPLSSHAPDSFVLMILRMPYRSVALCDVAKGVA